jgi:GrpB-like predicted nucleotidyltransferase (UPF0157 family)
VLAEYDREWPRLFRLEAARIASILSGRSVRVEHVGSTSVPGLAAKPIIDVLLVVANAADEAGYVPALEAHGYVLRIREPAWHEHRMLKGPDADINLHVFSSGCPEIDRMLLFRNWLRAHESDRRGYELTKRRLAQREWPDVQHYADAKSAVVEAIIARATRSPDP